MAAAGVFFMARPIGETLIAIFIGFVLPGSAVIVHAYDNCIGLYKCCLYYGGEGGIRTLAGAFAPLSI
jgi:hypothetical protein